MAADFNDWNQSQFSACLLYGRNQFVSVIGWERTFSMHIPMDFWFRGSYGEFAKGNGIFLFCAMLG